MVLYRQCRGRTILADTGLACELVFAIGSTGSLGDDTDDTYFVLAIAVGTGDSGIDDSAWSVFLRMAMPVWVTASVRRVFG